MGTARDQRASRRSAVVGLVAYTIVAVVLLWGAWHAPLTRNVGAGGDMPIFGWSLSWAPWAVGHLHNPLFTTHLDYEVGSNLMWNTTVLLPALLVAPITLLGTPILAFNVLATLGIVLPAWSLFLLLRLTTRHALAAWVGGLAWGFGPWVLAQTRGDHLHLTLGSLALPLLVFASYEAFIVQRRRQRTLGLIIGAAAAAWLLVGEESLAIAALAVGVGVAALALVSRGWWSNGGAVRTRYAAAVLGWALIAFVPLAAAPLGSQLLGPQRIHGSIFPNDSFDTDLMASVVPTSHQLIDAGGATSRRFHSEEGGYLGLPMILFAGAVAMRHRRGPAVKAAVVAIATLWILSLGSHLHIDGHATHVPLPWNLLRQLPPLGNLLPIRLSVAVAAIVAALFSAGVDDLLNELGTRRSELGPRRTGSGPRRSEARMRLSGTRRPPLRPTWIGGGLVGLAALITLAPSLPFRSTHLPVPAYFTSSEPDRIPAGSVVMVAPVARGDRPWVQLWQAEAGLRFRMEGGYLLVPDAHGRASFSGPLGPAGATVTAIETGAEPLAAASVPTVASDLRTLNVSTVIVGPMAHRAEVVELFTRTLRADPRQTGGVAVWYDVQRLLTRR